MSIRYCESGLFSGRTSDMDRQSIKTILLKKGLSMGDVAEKIGVSDNTLSRFFSDRTNLNCDAFADLLKLADIDLESMLSDRLAVCTAKGKKKDSILARLSGEQVKRFESWRNA